MVSGGFHYHWVGYTFASFFIIIIIANSSCFRLISLVQMPFFGLVYILVYVYVYVYVGVSERVVFQQASKVFITTISFLLLLLLLLLVFGKTRSTV